ncbi:MAG: hypothetical protein WA441_01530 [Methyloceanibacter sp.]
MATADFTFIVKEYHQGTFVIGAEQLDGDRLVLPTLLGFELAPGTSIEKAQEVARYMREHIRGIHYME